MAETARPELLSDKAALPAAPTRIVWSAIWAAAVLAIAVQMPISLLGIGVGLRFMNAQHITAGLPVPRGFGIGADLWWIAANLVGMYAGGYVAARLAGAERPDAGILHGLVTWAVALVLTLHLLSTALGSFLAGPLETLGQGPDLARPGPSEAALARSQLIALLPELIAGDEDATGARTAALALVGRVRGTQAAPVARDVEQVLSEGALPPSLAPARLASAALVACIALGLGAFVAAFAGLVGSLHHSRRAMFARPIIE